MGELNNAERGNISALMLNAIAEIGVLEKDAKNQRKKYSYTSSAAVVSAVRNALIGVGVAFAPYVIRHEVQEREVNGKTVRDYTVWMSFEFTSLDDGSKVEISWTGEARDWGDKGLQKAITSCTKYALMKTFLISSRNEPETDEGAGGPSANELIEELGREREKARYYDRWVELANIASDLGIEHDHLSIASSTKEEIAQAGMALKEKLEEATQD